MVVRSKMYGIIVLLCVIVLKTVNVVGTVSMMYLYRIQKLNNFEHSLHSRYGIRILKSRVTVTTARTKTPKFKDAQQDAEKKKRRRRRGQKSVPSVLTSHWLSDYVHSSSMGHLNEFVREYLLTPSVPLIVVRIWSWTHPRQF
jgi:hypothetical protein